MDTENNIYPSFKYRASEISAFGVCLDFFILSLTNGKIIDFTPNDVQGFYGWLIANNVKNVKKDHQLIETLRKELNKEI